MFVGPFALDQKANNIIIMQAVLLIATAVASQPPPIEEDLCHYCEAVAPSEILCHSGHTACPACALDIMRSRRCPMCRQSLINQAESDSNQPDSETLLPLPVVTVRRRRTEKLVIREVISSVPVRFHIPAITTYFEVLQ